MNRPIAQTSSPGSSSSLAAGAPGTGGTSKSSTSRVKQAKKPKTITHSETIIVDDSSGSEEGESENVFVEMKAAGLSKKEQNRRLQQQVNAKKLFKNIQAAMFDKKAATQICLSDRRDAWADWPEHLGALDSRFAVSCSIASGSLSFINVI